MAIKLGLRGPDSAEREITDGFGKHGLDKAGLDTLR